MSSCGRRLAVLAGGIVAFTVVAASCSSGGDHPTAIEPGGDLARPGVADGRPAPDAMDAADGINPRAEGGAGDVMPADGKSDGGALDVGDRGAGDAGGGADVSIADVRRDVGRPPPCDPAACPTAGGPTGPLVRCCTSRGTCGFVFAGECSGLPVFDGAVPDAYDPDGWRPDAFISDVPDGVVVSDGARG